MIILTHFTRGSQQYSTKSKKSDNHHNSIFVVICGTAGYHDDTRRRHDNPPYRTWRQSDEEVNNMATPVFSDEVHKKYDNTTILNCRLQVPVNVSTAMMLDKQQVKCRQYLPSYLKLAIVDTFHWSVELNCNETYWNIP